MLGEEKVFLGGDCVFIDCNTKFIVLVWFSINGCVGARGKSTSGIHVVAMKSYNDIHRK